MNETNNNVKVFSDVTGRVFIGEFIESNDVNKSRNEVYIYCGVFVFALFSIPILSTLIMHEQTKYGIAARNVLTAKLFEKSLSISQNTIPVGQLTNLMSSDTQIFEIFFLFSKKIISLFVILSLLLFFMQSYGGDLPTNASTYFYIGYFATPLIISGLISSVTYVLMRKPPKQVRKLNRYFRD